MAEYIERNKLLDDFELCNKQNPRWTPQRVKSLLVRATAADVAEVVRCKDCKFFDTEDRDVGVCVLHSAPLGKFDVAMNHDDFCVYGRRKVGDGR